MRPFYRREIATLPVPPLVREKLQIAGFRIVADLEGVGPVELSDETGVTRKEALEVLKVALSKERLGVVEMKTALELLEKDRATRRIITFCQDLDGILGGGVPRGRVTEFCGAPGTGKTQLGIQLAIDVQIPAAVKGVGGAAVYIDTEGSFTVQRTVQMATNAVAHIQKNAGKLNCINDPSVRSFTVEQILANIHYFRVFDYVKQVAVINSLPAFVEQHPNIKLVVVDSIAFHFRQGFSDMAHRTRILLQMSHVLVQLAEARDVAIVFMNHVTTRVIDDEKSKLVPSLGETWAHCASTRAMLYWEGDQRVVHVYKTLNSSPARAPFWVTRDGIRGITSHGAPS